MWNKCGTKVYGLSDLIMECFDWAGGGNLEDVFIYKISYFSFILLYRDRSQWPRGLRRRSTTALPLARSPAGPLARSVAEIVGSNNTGGMDVCCECCVLSGRGLCDGLITRPEESYRLWRVVVCDQETSNTRRLKPATGL